MDSLNNSTFDAANPNAGWSFRALDGAGRITWTSASTAPAVSGTGRLPTLENLVDGTWEQQGWISFNVPSHTTGNKLALANNFVAAARSPAVLASQDNLKFVAAAIPGTPDPSVTNQVLRAGYYNNDQCAPLNRDF